MFSKCVVQKHENNLNFLKIKILKDIIKTVNKTTYRLWENICKSYHHNGLVSSGLNNSKAERQTV